MGASAVGPLFPDDHGSITCKGYSLGPFATSEVTRGRVDFEAVAQGWIKTRSDERVTGEKRNHAHPFCQVMLSVQVTVREGATTVSAQGKGQP